MTTTDIGMQSGASQNQSGFVYRLTHRELEHYPRIKPRSIQLAIVVISTIALYYESYVGGSVSTLLLQKLGMSFMFYVVAIAIGNLIGAFGSLVAGVADRVGRANLVVTGLLVTGLATLFLIPAMTSKWPFILSTFLVGVIEGIALVATPALIRDFSPQTGRATAMGLWTTGPVLGSLVVAVVGSATITATTQWQTEYRICGAIGLLVFLVALFGMRELSPRLRDQLMVSTKDRVLIEAKAKGIDIEASLAHPWRQMLKADIIISALAVSVMLLIYYTAVGFGTIVMTTVFGFSLRNANGIANWQWGANAVGLIVIGIISDKLRVRKPLMIFGAVGGTVLTVIFIGLLGKTVSYYEMALILATISVFLAFAYAPWMASFTETVEARNPALTATGLAIWGWTLRMVVFVSFLILPLIVTSVTPLVSYGAKVKAYANQYKEQIAFAETHASLISFAKTHASLIAFAETHPQIIATATKYQTQLANAQRFAPELSVIEHNPTIFSQLAKYTNPSQIPSSLISQAIAAAGGGAKGQQIVGTIAQNSAAIDGVIAVAPQLQTLAPYTTQLKELAANASEFQQLQANAAQLNQLKAVAPALTFLQEHATAVVNAAKNGPSQWKTWYWICVAAFIFFMLSVPLMKGRWSPAKAKKDEEEHENMVQEELKQLHLV